MIRFAAVSLAAALVFSNVAHAAPLARVRGTILAASATTVTVQLADGQSQNLSISAATHFAAASKASLSDVKPGSYIGTATKDTNGRMVALEVVVFPAAMRGTGDGHYAWDVITDTTAGGGKAVASSMTNGNVVSALPAKTASSMTNGSVQSASGAAGMRKLMVTYQGGAQTIYLPPSAPVVTFAPAGPSALTVGAPVFAIGMPAAGGFAAKFIVVGTGGAKLAM